MLTTVEIEAASLSEAVEDFLTGSLPSGEYLKGSLLISSDGIEDMNDVSEQEMHEMLRAMKLRGFDWAVD